MDKFTKEEKELMQMDVMDSFNEADRFDWLRYVFILTHRYYGDFQNAWFNKTYPFWVRYMRRDIKYLFSKTDYLEKDKYKEIRETVKAFGLDIEKFWYLLLFIYDYVDCHLSRGKIITDTSKTAFAKHLMKQLDNINDEDVEITIKCNRKRIKISEIGKQSILAMLNEGYKHLYKDNNFYDLATFDGKAQFSLSYHINMAVEMYDYTFDYLENEGKEICVDKSSGASLNKKLLFSRIMHLYRWTENDSFLFDDSSLKGILKSYKTKSLPPIYSDAYY